MRRRRDTARILPLLFVMIATVCGAGGDPLDAIDAALSQWGVGRSDLRLKTEEMALWGESRRLPLYDLFRSDPLRLEPYTRSFRIQGIEAAGSAASMLFFASWRAGLPVRRGLVPALDSMEEWKRQAAKPGALAEAIIALRENAGPMTDTDKTLLLGAVARVPTIAAAPAALLLRAIASSAEWRAAALEPVGGSAASLRARAMDSLLEDEDRPVDIQRARSLERDADRVDLRRLVAGAEDLALACDIAVEMLSQPAAREAGAFSLRFETPLGDVLLRGTGADRLANESAGSSDAPRPRGPENILLLLDLGGDDTYLMSAGAEPSSGIQVWIDMAGDDVYRAPASAPVAFGAGVAGYGLLIDVAGDDSYDAGPASLGAGFFGVGLLLDKAGNDRYRGAELTQGAASHGLGVLADSTGSDEYRAVQMAQGFGGVGGAGILVDGAGDDFYEASDRKHRHTSAQTPEHSASFAQGAASGNRADYIDGHSEAGGIGMLLDGAGNDVYRAELFAQGCAYWYGIGLLSDGGGNDIYEAVWYAQGSGAHFAIGFLLDESGSDRYKASMNMAQGAGHDFSFGWLLDGSGNDTYQAPNLSLGAGNDNGIGFFWDRGGDDVYDTTGALTLGRAAITAPRGGVRDFIRCIGLFVDTGGGRDDYRGQNKGSAANDSTWKGGAPDGSSLTTEIGAGIDR